MKMRVREAIDYAVKADGMPYTMELQDKLYYYFKKLPRNPQMDSWGEFTICDYSEGWYVKVLFGQNDSKLYVEIEDCDKLDYSDEMVKSNKEAMEILDKISKIKFASDIDKYWDMSDDHGYWRRMSDFDKKATNEYNRLVRKL